MTLGFLAAAAPYLAIASAGIGALGIVQQGQAEAASAKYQAQVARNNAIIAQQYREAATKQGEAEAYTQGLRNRQKVGALVAGYAASGIDVNTGSPAQVRTGEQETTYTDVERVRQAAALKAYGYGIEGSNFAAQAGLDTAQAGYAGPASFLRAGGLLLSGLSTVSPKFAALLDSANPDIAAGLRPSGIFPGGF